MMIGSRQGVFFLEVELQVDRLKKSRTSDNPGRRTGQVPVHRNRGGLYNTDDRL